MKAIFDILVQMLHAHPIRLQVVVVAVITFVLSRVSGKLFDEFLDRLRKRKSYERKLADLNDDLRAANHRADAAEQLAERSVRLMHEYHWQLVQMQNYLHQLQKRSA